MIIFKDQHIIAVNKPNNVLVHHLKWQIIKPMKNHWFSYFMINKNCKRVCLANGFIHKPFTEESIKIITKFPKDWHTIVSQFKWKL